MIDLTFKLDDGFKTVIDRVASTLDDDELYPTAYALRRTMRLLLDAYPKVLAPFPRASVVPTEDRGITMYWRSLGRNVHLIVPNAHGGLEFIYHRVDNTYGSERDINAERLAHWLNIFKRTP